MRPTPVSTAALAGLATTFFCLAFSHPAHPASRPHCDGAASSDTRTETRPVTGDFTAVTLSSSADVVVKIGSPASITISGTDEQVRYTETVIEKGTLVVRWNSDGKKISWRNNQPTTVVTVTVPAVEALAVLSSGDMRVEGKITGNNFSVRLSGSGDIHIPSAELRGEVTTALQGSGDIHLAGFCAQHSITLAGSGDIKASDLRATTATVRLAGSGDVSVRADEKLDASVAGSGDVRYAGSPRELVKHVSGSGSVARL